MNTKITVLTYAPCSFRFARPLRVGRVQDKTRWTNALGEAATVVYGGCNEDIDLSNIAAGGI